MGNNVMREQIQRSNDEKTRPSRQNCHGCQLCGNRRARRPGSPSRPNNPTHRTTTAPRTVGAHAATQDRSRLPSAAGARIPSSVPRRPKRVRPPSHITRTPVLKSSRRRRHRKRLRSRPNTQSGGPVGGDFAVPGDQPTPPQPPEGLRSQAEDAAELVRQDVCLPITPQPRTSSATTSDTCQRVIPTRWTFLRKSVQKLRESQLDVGRSSSINSGQPAVQSSAKFISDILVGAGMKRSSGTPATDIDEVVPPMQTGFYFGTSNRRSWPHSGASAEYFTAVANRRIKKLEPSLKSDEITFEVDEEDPREKSCSAAGRDDQVVEAAANAEAAAAVLVRSDRVKRSSRRPHTDRRAPPSSSTSTRTGKTARLRRARRSTASSTHMRGSVMHDVLMKILAVGQRRNNKRPRKSADGPRRSTSNDRSRSTATRTTPVGRSPSPDRDIFTPKSCLMSTKASSEEINTYHGHPRRLSTRGKDDGHFVSHRNSREFSSIKTVREHRPHNRRQTPQQRRAEKVQTRTATDAPKRCPKTKPVPGNCRRKTYSAFIPNRILRAISKSFTGSIGGSASFQEAEYSTVDTSCTETDTTRTTPTESFCRFVFDFTGETDRAEKTYKRGPNYTWVGGTIPNKSDDDKIQEKQEDTIGFEHHGQIQTAEEYCNICPSFISSKIGSNGTLNAQLLIDRVICNPAGSIDSYPNDGPTRTFVKRTKKLASKDPNSGNTVANKGVQLSANTKCIPRGMSLKSQKTSSDNAMRCLVKSSVKVQNAVFPHLGTAARVSKTTQITPGDLVSILGGSVEGDVSENLPSKTTVYETQKCTELPLHEDAIPSTSDRKARKTARLKRKLNMLSKHRRLTKYKFVKRTSSYSGSKAPSTSKRIPPCENVNSKRRNAVVKEQDTALLLPTTKSQKRKVQASEKNFEAPISATCMLRSKLIPHKIHRVQHNVEDNSRSELVSLFRADTRGSSIQSVEVGSSNSMFGVKPTIFLDQERRASTRSKSRAHNTPEKVNLTGLESQSKRGKVGMIGKDKRIERTKQTTSKPPVSTRIKLLSIPAGLVQGEQTPEQPRDTASQVHSYEQKDSVPQIPKIFIPKTSSQWSPRYMPTDSMPNRPSLTSERVETTCLRSPGDSASKTMHLKPLESTVSTSRRSRSMSESGSKLMYPRQPSSLPSLQTSRRPSGVKETSKASSGFVPKVLPSTPSVDFNSTTLSPRSSHDKKQKIQTPKSWSGSRQDQHTFEATSEIRGKRHYPTVPKPLSKSHSPVLQKLCSPISHKSLSHTSSTSQKSRSPSLPKLHSFTPPKPCSSVLKQRSQTSPKPLSLSSSKSLSPTSHNPFSPRSQESQSLSLKPSAKSGSHSTSKLRSPASSKTHTPTSPKARNPTLSKPHTSTSSKTRSPTTQSCSNKKATNIWGNFKSRANSPRQPHDTKPKEYAAISTIQSEHKSLVQRTAPHNIKNSNLPLRPRKIFKKRRAPSPPVEKSCQGNTIHQNTDSTEKLNTISRIEKQLFNGWSAKSDHSNDTTRRNLTPPATKNDEVREYWKIQSDQNSFNFHLSDSFQYRPVQDISTSHCSNEVNEGFSPSSTSMIPAVGSYEDKFSSPGAWHKSDDSNHSIGNFVTPKCMLEHPSSPEIPVKPFSYSQYEVQERAKGHSENERNATSCVGGQAARQNSVPNQCADTHWVGGSADEEARKDFDHIHTTRSTGIRCKAGSRGALNTDGTTEHSQPKLCCGTVESQKHQSNGGHMTEELCVKRNQGPVSVKGTIFALQSNKSGCSTGYSAESVAMSVLERLSSQDITESYCQIYTQSDIASNRKQAARDISSLTDAVSCISSIPEDTLPKATNSNSTTCEVLFEEFSCDDPEKEVQQPTPFDTFQYRYCDNTSRTSLSHPKYSKEGPHYPLGMTEEVYEKPCGIKIIQPNSAPDTKSNQRSYRSPAAMHVSWDTSLSKFCVHETCSRCGALRTEGAETCQPVPTCWHDPQIQEDQYCATEHLHARCVRCGKCLRDKRFNNDRWSQSSPTILPSPCTHHMLCHDHADKPSADILQNNFGTTCTVAARMKTEQDVCQTPTHPFSCISFPQAPRSLNAHIPQATAESWHVLQPDPKPPQCTKSGANSSQNSNERVNEDGYWADGHYVEPSRLAVASFWPTVPTPESKSLIDTPAVNVIKMKSCMHHPHLTLSPVYTTSLPEEVVTEGASSPFNKDIVLQRVADLLETHSSILSIDSYNKVVLKEVDRCVGTEETKPISKFSHKNSAGNHRISAATSTNEPPDAHLERVVAGIADRVNDFLRDMAQVVGELQHRN